MIRPLFQTTRRWIGAVCRRGPTSPVALAQAAARRLDGACQQLRPKVWSVMASQQFGYQVSVQFLALDEWVVCMVDADLIIDRDWVSRELALRLLEENTRCAYGSFRLLPVNYGLALVHAQVCDWKLFSAEKLADIGRTMRDQYQQMLVQLYACDLILPGPLSPPSSSPTPR